MWIAVNKNDFGDSCTYTRVGVFAAPDAFNSCQVVRSDCTLSVLTSDCELKCIALRSRCSRSFCRGSAKRGCFYREALPVGRVMLGDIGEGSLQLSQLDEDFLLPLLFFSIPLCLYIAVRLLLWDYQVGAVLLSIVKRNRKCQSC